MPEIISEQFIMFDHASQVGMAATLDEPVGRRVALRMKTDGEQLSGRVVPEKYRERLRAKMRERIAMKNA